MSEKHSKTDVFKALTWDDIEKWAGSEVVSRGRSYQRNHQVQNLARTPSGGLVAWVQGTQRYATLVDVDDEGLTSECTCPYWDTCKHAVAVVFEHLAHAKQNREVPSVTGRDPRLALLQEAPSEEEQEDDEDADEDEGLDRMSSSQPEEATPDELVSYLEQQTKSQLISLLEELAQRYPEVNEALRDRRNLSRGAVAKLVSAVRGEIHRLSSQAGWRNSWSNEGNIPDYSRVRERLAALLSQGHADEVVALGEELLEAGTRQVEMSEDEGETGEEISSCLDVVFQALPQSSLSTLEQMLWVVDAELKDEYDLCEGAGAFWEREHAAEDWSDLADKLLQRLDRFNHQKEESDFSRSYRRNQLSDQIILALEKAGREDEIIPLCEREAEETRSYVRLVNRLVEANRLEEAEHWIRKGVQATTDGWPGIAGQLRDAMQRIYEKRNDWPRVAALLAEDFFSQPSLHALQALQTAAERAGVRPAVRAAAMRYLETGELPGALDQTAGAQPTLPWPLPETGLPKDLATLKKDFPDIATLLAIAISEKQPDEVLRWYDQPKPKSFGIGWGWSVNDDRVAEAIADAYPERAIAIWKTLAERQIARTEPKAYEEAASYLRKMRPVMERLGKEGEWQDYLAELRQTHARKRRLLETLDRLSGRPIIETS
jgi:uncharacterized Zn finger protein